MDLIKMEFRCFLHAIVLLPAQIVRTGRRVIYLIMSYNNYFRVYARLHQQPFSPGANLEGTEQAIRTCDGAHLGSNAP